MATTPVAPASSPVSAPAAPATPTSTPVSTPEVSTPVTPSTTPTSEPTSPSTEPSSPSSAPASKPEPTQADFPGDIETFLREHAAWERDGGVHEDTPEITTEPDAAAEAARQKVEGEEKPPEVEKDKPWGEEQKTVTPEVVNSWLDAKPAFKALMESDPQLKNEIFAMARVNAKAQPILEIYPNVEAATFANETSNKWVGLQGGFKATIDNPESFPAVFEQFASEFMITGKDGTPVLDAAGNPTFGEDFHLMMNHIVDTRDTDDLKSWQAKLDANPGDENADMAIKAINFLKELRGDSKNDGKPSVENLTPEQRAWQEKMEREFSDRESKLDGANKAQTKEQRQLERTNFEDGLRKKVGGLVGNRLKNYMQQKEKDGIFIPSYVTDVRDPEAGISAFAKTIFDKWQLATVGKKDPKTGKVTGGVAYIREQMERLQRLPPNADSERQRMEKMAELVDNHLPNIIDKELRQIQTKHISDIERRSTTTQQARANANVEPLGGAAPTPQTLNDSTAFSRAQEFVDKNFPDLDRKERMVKVFQEKNRLLAR